MREQTQDIVREIKEVRDIAAKEEGAFKIAKEIKRAIQVIFNEDKNQEEEKKSSPL